MIITLMGATSNQAMGNPEPETYSLADLETVFTVAPAVLTAAAELEESAYLLEQMQARQGLRVFGEAATGIYNEPVTSESSRNYQNIRIRAGLRYPLLGSRNRERMALLDGQDNNAEKIEHYELSQRDSLRALRLHYINYWDAQEKIRLSRIFLKDAAAVSDLLGARMRAGFLLEADHQEFLSAYALARRNIANLEAVLNRSLSTIQQLTSDPPGPFQAIEPTISVPDVASTQLIKEMLVSHPELVQLRNRVELTEQKQKIEGGTDLEADVSLGGDLSTEFEGDQQGYGLTLSFKFELPAGLRKAETAGRRRTHAILKRRQYLLNHRSAELQMELHDLYKRNEAASKNITFAIQRLKAALERVRENTLRAQYMRGDVIEKLEQSRFQYYLTAMDYTEARSESLRLKTRLLHYLPTEYAPANAAQKAAINPNQSLVDHSLLKPPDDIGHQALPSIDSGWADLEKVRIDPNTNRYTLYVWNSRRLLAAFHQNPPALWERLRMLQANRLLLSLDLSQITAIQTPRSSRPFEAFIVAAANQGIRVELLLGEPTWILPQHRANLLEIIQKLRHLPFDGLHLDLEPNQLSGHHYDEAFLLNQLIQTLDSAVDISPWPVSLSLHPRFFDPIVSGTCLGCALSNLKLREVALMIYIANGERTARIAHKVMQRYPDIQFSVAQSVEATLSPNESHARIGRQEFQKRMASLHVALAADNFNGLMVQSWNDYGGMKP